MGFCDAVASAGQYTNNLHFAPKSKQITTLYTGNSKNMKMCAIVIYLSFLTSNDLKEVLVLSQTACVRDQKSCVRQQRSTSVVGEFQ